MMLLAALCALAPAPLQLDTPPIRFGDDEALEYTREFFPETTYDPAIPRPDELLGQLVGSRCAHHEEVVEYLTALSEVSPRVEMQVFGQTHEGRDLMWVAISSEANMRRLEEIRADHARLFDPRGLSDADARGVLDRTVPVAWMAYSIHGDEMSGVDAALAVAHHLAAGTSQDVTGLLEDLVVVIDPIMNPDGRERILTQLEQSAGYVSNLDHASMHRGRWPFGRGNHYLFDMNRDWLPGTQPETRARWAAVRSFAPQLFVDAHEMGSLDTFLFYPARDPINDHVPEYLRESWKLFGDQQAAAFDRYGWSYYTREWADYWYPGYSDAWGSLNGAVGILYEQARYLGQSLRRSSGEIITYREAVHHQAVGSLANLRTLAENGDSLLQAFLEHRRRNVAAATPGNDRMFVFSARGNTSRERSLLRNLLGQGVEVSRAAGEFEARSCEDGFGRQQDSRVFPAGTYVVRAAQPQSPIVKTAFEVDPRVSKEVLEKERNELETKDSSTMYDVTAWSMAHALDLDGWWVDARDVDAEAITEVPEAPARVVPAADGEAAVYGWVVDGTDDASVRFAARALDRGLALHLSDREFTSAGRPFARGSLLVRRHENPADTAERVARCAEEAGATAYATTSGRSVDDGPDLGGGHFTLLSRPRVALLSNSPVSTSSFGHTWHTLDVAIGVPFTLLDAQSLGSYDLRRYNVLIVPPGGTSRLVRDHVSALRTWVRSGGTLIAIGSSANAMLGEDVGLSSVTRRRDGLEKLDEYAFAVQRERAAGTTEIDEALVWGDARPEDEAAVEEEEDATAGDDSLDPDVARQDAWERRFSPQGAILRGEVNPHSWLTVGCHDELPVQFSGSTVLHATRPTQVAVRFAPEDRLRLGGLVWPEARKRIADGVWATVERAGDGQLILFATQPDFRGWFEGTRRLLMNAVVYGPGAGANLPSEW